MLMAAYEGGSKISSLWMAPKDKWTLKGNGGYFVSSQEFVLPFSLYVNVDYG